MTEHRHPDRRMELTGERTVPGVAAENYWFRRHLAAYRWAARVREGATVLDAGAGEGYGAALLSRNGVVVALDLDEAAAVNASRSYPTLRVVRGDCCHLPVSDRSVGAVVALQVIEHLHCAERFVEVCARALRPNGRLIVSTPNRATFPGGVNPFHTHEFVAEELEGLLRTAFRAVQVLGLRHRTPLRLLDRVLGEPVQHRLVRAGYEGMPAWTRAVLRTVTSRDFRIAPDAADALDLVAVGTGTIER